MAIRLPSPKPRVCIHAARTMDLSKICAKVSLSRLFPLGEDMKVLLAYLSMASRRYERNVFGHWGQLDSRTTGSMISMTWDASQDHSRY